LFLLHLPLLFVTEMGGWYSHPRQGSK